MRRRTAALVAVVGALALSGCMRMNIDITLSEEDTAEGVFVFAVSDQLAEAIGMEPEELFEEGAGEVRGDLPPEATEEPYSEDGYTGSRFTFAEQPIDTFAGTEEDLTIRREGDEYVVTGVMDLTDPSGDADDVPQEMLDSFDVRVAITFPGEVTEASGTIEGNTVVWRPPFGERTELSARGSAVATPEESSASPGESAAAAPNDDGAPDDSDAASDGAGAGFPWWAVALAAAGLLLLGLIAWLVVRANRAPVAAQASPQPGVPGGAGSYPPQGGPQYPAPYQAPNQQQPYQPPPDAPPYQRPPDAPPYQPPPGGAGPYQPPPEPPSDPYAPPSGEPRPPAPPQ